MYSFSKKEFSLFMVLAILYAILITFISYVNGKVVSVGPFVSTIGVFITCLTLLILNVIQTFFGKELTHKVVNYSLVVRALMIIFSLFVIMLPTAFPNDTKAKAVNIVFSTSIRLAFAGIMARLIADNLEVSIFAFLRKLFKEKFLPIRTFLSDLLSTYISTVVYITLAFAYTGKPLLRMYFSDFFIKTIYVFIFDTILVSLVVGLFLKLGFQPKAR